jgi:hypothetical protein
MIADYLVSAWWTVMVFCVGYLSATLTISRIRGECRMLLDSSKKLDESSKALMIDYLKMRENQ